MRVPKHVLQVYHNVARYGPERHTAEGRREIIRWNDVILSKSGAVQEGAVHLSEGVTRPEGRFASCDLVVLNDWNSDDSRRALPEVPSLLTLPAADAAGMARLSIFGVRGRSGAGLELHLLYSENASWIGRPRRDDFKVADLREDRPVLVRINGKSDFTLSGRMERRYLLAESVFEYLGEFDDFVVLPEVRTGKRPPVGAARVVDLTRVLW